VLFGSSGILGRDVAEEDGHVEDMVVECEVVAGGSMMARSLARASRNCEARCLVVCRNRHRENGQLTMGYYRYQHPWRSSSSEL